MPHIKDFKDVNCTLLKSHPEKDLIMSEISNLAIVFSLLGYRIYYNVGYGFKTYMEDFVFIDNESLNNNDFLKISFTRKNNDDEIMDIIYPICWLSKLKDQKDIFGILQRVKNKKNFLEKIKNIILYL